MELMEIKEDDIQVVLGKIDFPQYSDLLKQATELATWLKNIEINEENLTDAKKLVAETRKRVNALEDVRKNVKKEVMFPYMAFEAQVKEITRIVKDAEDLNREKIRQFDEKERAAKEHEVKRIFTLRMSKYADLKNIVKFDKFLKQEYLNKTYSMNKVEQDMVDRLEAIKRDINVINNMDNSQDLVIEYVESDYDLTSAIEQINKRNALKEEIEVNIKQEFKIIFNNESDFRLAKILLEKESINFKED